MKVHAEELCNFFTEYCHVRYEMEGREQYFAEQIFFLTSVRSRNWGLESGH